MHSRQKLPCLPCSSYCFLFQVQKEKDIPNTNKKIVTKVNTNISVSVQDRTTNVKREASADPTSDQNASSGTSSDKVISQYLANATSEIAGLDTRFSYFFRLSRNTRFGLEGILWLPSPHWWKQYSHCETWRLDCLGIFEWRAFECSQETAKS